MTDDNVVRTIAFRRMAQQDAQEPSALQHGEGGGTFVPMEGSDHGKRIWWLELGLCAGFVAVVAGGFALYDKADEQGKAAQAQVANVAANVMVLNERTSAMDKKLDGISAKLDKK